MATPAAEPTLADVQREYPDWTCWRAVSGLCYARPATAESGEPASVMGEDPLDLRDQIRRALSRAAEAAYRDGPASSAEPGGPSAGPP